MRSIRDPLPLKSDGLLDEVLNLFRKGDRVSSAPGPGWLVKSDETAGIDVGDEVPVVTRVSDSDQQVGGTTNVLPEASYRKTGVQRLTGDVVRRVAACARCTGRRPTRGGFSGPLGGVLAGIYSDLREGNAEFIPQEAT